MEVLALFGIIIIVFLILLLFIGYCYVFYVIANMDSAGGEPYIRVDTNLQPLSKNTNLQT